MNMGQVFDNFINLRESISIIRSQTNLKYLYQKVYLNIFLKKEISRRLKKLKKTMNKCDLTYDFFIDFYTFYKTTRDTPGMNVYKNLREDNLKLKAIKVYDDLHKIFIYEKVKDYDKVEGYEILLYKESKSIMVNTIYDGVITTEERYSRLYDGEFHDTLRTRKETTIDAIIKYCKYYMQTAGL